MALQIGIVVVAVVAACMLVGLAVHQPSSELAGIQPTRHAQVHQRDLCQMSRAISWGCGIPLQAATADRSMNKTSRSTCDSQLAGLRSASILRQVGQGLHMVRSAMRAPLLRPGWLSNVLRDPAGKHLRQTAPRSDASTHTLPATAGGASEQRPDVAVGSDPSASEPAGTEATAQEQQSDSGSAQQDSATAPGGAAEPGQQATQPNAGQQGGQQTAIPDSAQAGRLDREQQPHQQQQELQHQPGTSAIGTAGQTPLTGTDSVQPTGQQPAPTGADSQQDGVEQGSPLSGSQQEPSPTGAGASEQLPAAQKQASVEKEAQQAVGVPRPSTWSSMRKLPNLHESVTWQ